MSDLIERQAAIDAMCDASIPIVYKGKPSFVVDYLGVIASLPSVSTEKKNVEIVKFDTPYTDTISRQVAIDAMREETCMSCWDAKDILEHLPSVSTEKTGRWIDQGYKEEWWAEYYKCSECGYGMVGVDNYCPNCGAKMGVEDADSN